MKLVQNVNLSTINETGLDTAIVISARDRKVMSAIGHGLLAAAYACKAAGAGAATVCLIKEAATKTNDATTRFVSGGVAIATGVGTGVYTYGSYDEARKAIADAKEAMQMGK